MFLLENEHILIRYVKKSTHSYIVLYRKFKHGNFCGFFVVMICFSLSIADGAQL
jgi:hypothetical protein